MKKFGEGIAFGKVILIGEHFVVYGLPAIASGLRSLKTHLRVREGEWNRELDNEIIAGLMSISRHPIRNR